MLAWCEQVATGGGCGCGCVTGPAAPAAAEQLRAAAPLEPGHAVTGQGLSRLMLLRQASQVDCQAPGIGWR